MSVTAPPSPAPAAASPGRRRLARLAVAGGLLAAGALVPVAAYAGHVGFTDGPFGVHENGIHFVSASGVTAGCGDGTRYCPNDPVTRAQMGTFMHRLSGNAATPPSVNAASVAGLTPATLSPFAVAKGGTPASTTSATYVDLPTASATVTIPAGRTGVVVADFAAESVCSGTNAWCTVRILIDGAEAGPAAGDDFAFDSSDASTESVTSWESHAMTRSSEVLPAGTYTVEVEYAGQGSDFRLDDWHLTAEVKFVS